MLTIGRAPGSASRIIAADRVAAVETLTPFRAQQDEADAAAMSAAAEALVAGKLAHLEVGSDLDDAVNLIRHWLCETD